MANPAIWHHRNIEHVGHFAALIKPLARAAGTAGTRIYDDPQVSAETVQAWILALRDVPADVLEEARNRLLTEGITWMPRPGDLKRHCVAIVAEQRRAIAAEVQALLARCECGGHEPGWELVTDAQGVERLRRCRCWRLGQERLAQAPPALALPPARDLAEADA